MATTPPGNGTAAPAEVIAPCVWLYHRFPLSFREVEELMLARSAIVSCETIRLSSAIGRDHGKETAAEPGAHEQARRN